MPKKSIILHLLLWVSLAALILFACNGTSNTDSSDFEIRNINLYATEPATFEGCMVPYDNYWDQLANCDHQILWPDWEDNGTAYKAFTVAPNRILVVQIYAVNGQKDTVQLAASLNGGPTALFELDFSEWGQLGSFEIGVDVLSDNWSPGVYELNYWLEAEYGRTTPVYTLEIQVGP
jgi:hypothetical protein